MRGINTIARVLSVVGAAGLTKKLESEAAMVYHREP